MNFLYPIKMRKKDNNKVTNNNSVKKPEEITFIDSPWTYFAQPKFIGSYLYQGTIKLMQFQNILPQTINATEIKIVLFLKAKNEIDKNFYTKITILNGDITNHHWNYGSTQNTSSSQTIIFKIGKTRSLSVSSDLKQQEKIGKVQMQFYILAYR